MKPPKQKQGRSKYDREKFIRVKCKVDSDDNNEGGDGSSSDGSETGDCSNDSNASDDTEMYCEDCKPRKSKKNSSSSNSDSSSDSERSSKTRHNSKKKGFSLFVVAAKKTDILDSESDSDSSDRMEGKRDKKKRKTSNDAGCGGGGGGGGSRKKSKDSKKSSSLRIKKINTESCDDLNDISCPMKILRRFICQGYEESKMKCRKSKQALANKDCESLELDSEDDCERDRSRKDKKKKSSKSRGSSVPAKECKEFGNEGSSKKKRSVSYSNDTRGKKTSSKCCQTVSIDFTVKPKKPKYDSKTRSKSCQTSKHSSAVYSLTQVRKPSVYFMPPNQNPPDKNQTNCSEHCSLPATGQINCPQNRHQDTCGNNSQKPPVNTVNTLELHVDLGGSHKKQHCSKEKERETKPHSAEENMKWCERAFRDEFENLVKKYEEVKPGNQPTKGSSNKKCKSKSKISKTESKRKGGARVEKEASIVLNATDLSMLAQMMVQLSSTEPNSNC